MTINLRVEQVRVTEVCPKLFKVSVGTQGPPGPSASDVLPFLAGATVGGDRLVYVDGNQRVFHANNTVEAEAFQYLGISLNAGDLGDAISVRKAGIHTFAGWTWNPGDHLFLGVNGMLTSTPPATGFLLQVAVALSATRILLKDELPIGR